MVFLTYNRKQCSLFITPIHKKNLNVLSLFKKIYNLLTVTYRLNLKDIHPTSDKFQTVLVFDISTDVT